MSFTPIWVDPFASVFQHFLLQRCTKNHSHLLFTTAVFYIWNPFHSEYKNEKLLFFTFLRSAWNFCMNRTPSVCNYGAVQRLLVYCVWAMTTECLHCCSSSNSLEDPKNSGFLFYFLLFWNHDERESVLCPKSISCYFYVLGDPFMLAWTCTNLWIIYEDDKNKFLKTRKY